MNDAGTIRLNGSCPVVKLGAGIARPAAEGPT